MILMCVLCVMFCGDSLVDACCIYPTSVYFPTVLCQVPYCVILNIALCLGDVVTLSWLLQHMCFSFVTACVEKYTG